MVTCLVDAEPVGAHQPLYLGPAQATPESGPRIEDGTVSFAVYTTLERGGDTRGLRFTLESGDPLLVELLLPDQEPERALAAPDLPTMTLVSPTGVPTVIESAVGEAFDEPFTNTRYLRLARFESVAEAGTYGLLVTAAAPARVTIVVGREERSGSVEGSSEAGSVADWWSTPPAAAPTPTVPGAAAQTTPPPVASSATGTPVPQAVAVSDVPPATTTFASAGSAAGVADQNPGAAVTASDLAGPTTAAGSAAADAAPPAESPTTAPAIPDGGYGDDATPWWLLWALLPVAVLVIAIRLLRPKRRSGGGA